MTTSPSTRRYYLTVAAIILALKLLLLAFDHLPMFFLGDSVAYLDTAKWHYIPLDRSFLYGWIIRVIALNPGSLTLLMVAQTLASAASAFLCVFILRRYFSAPPLLAAAMGILCALEPLQLLYERYVMTEAFSLTVFAVFTTLALEYLRKPRWWILAILQLTGTLLIALRFSFLPIVQLCTILVPLLPLLAASANRRLPRLAGHVALSLACFFALHTTYKYSYAGLIQSQLPGAAPAYLYDKGFHLLCFVAPIVEPQDFPDAEKRAAVFNVAFDLKDPAERGRHRWWDGGLIKNIIAAYPNDVLKANRLAEQTAHHALLHHPLAELRLASVGFLEYFNLQHLQTGLITDQGGDRDLPDDLVAFLHDNFHLDARPLPHTPTFTNRYYFFVWPWYLVLLLLPIPSFLLIRKISRATRPGAILLFTFAASQIAIVAVCSITPTVRFLHPLAWQAPILLGTFFSRSRS